jgi:hypothetical protein
MSKPPRLAPSAREIERLKARKRRAALAKQDQDLFELLVCGHSYEAIALAGGVSVATLRRRVDRGIAKRQLDSPMRYIHLQVERLNKAFLHANNAAERQDLKGVDLMMKLIDRLDRYHGLDDLHRAAPAARGEQTTTLVPPPEPLALSHVNALLALAAPEGSE